MKIPPQVEVAILERINARRLAQIQTDDVFDVIRRVVDEQDEESTTLDVAAFQSAI